MPKLLKTFGAIAVLVAAVMIGSGRPPSPRTR